MTADELGASSDTVPGPVGPGRWWVRARAVVAASDPGLVRLRTAATTVITLVVAAGVLVAVATLLGLPVTSALPGVVVAMIATVAVNDPTPRGRAVSSAWLVPAAAVTATASAVLGPHRVASIVVFVLVAVGAVFAQRLGPRGIAAGMVGFIAYFLVMFLRIPVTQVPAVIGAVALGAAVSVGMRTLLRARHPDRDLRRMLSALTVRVAWVVDALADAVRGQAWDRRTTDRLRVRLDRARLTALAVETRLEAADHRLLDSIGNTALGVRVFDVQLGLEHLTRRAAEVVAGPGLSAPDRDVTAGHLDGLCAALRHDDADDPERWTRLARRLERTDELPTPETERLRHTLVRLVDAWSRAVAPAELAPDDDPHTDIGQEPGADDRPAEPAPGPAPHAVSYSQTVRRAVQVAVATSVAIGVGELLSPTRWFWAVIAAFVVFTGASSRGQVLSKGWQRVVGTVAGVFAGVAVAGLVGNHTGTAVALIAVCLFLGLYLMSVASGWMMFFITTLLALVYGLLGQFSIGLLLLRLEETAVGAAAGVAVSFLLLPTRTRPAVAAAVNDLLDAVPEVLDDALHALTEPLDPAAPVTSRPAPARVLRQSYATLRTTAEPLTDGLAGITGRSGFRRTVALVGVVEHHARALVRLAHRHAGIGAAPATRDALRDAVAEVVARTGSGPRDTHPAGGALDRLDDAARRAGRADLRTAGAAPRGTSTNAAMIAAAGHLRAIDRAVVELTTRLGRDGAGTAAAPAVDAATASPDAARTPAP